MKLRNLGVALAGMAFLGVSAFAQITTIEGIVKGADGKPVEKAEIQITRTDIKGSYKTKTDKKGHYLYMGLPMGKYTIDVVVDGKKADSVSNQQRVFVPRASLRSVEVLGVVGSPLKRKKATAKEQGELFE